VIDFGAMVSLACLMHWYISMLYVVPVVAVGGWCWWSSKRMSRRRSDPPKATRAA
jgi:protein-S-isoprenylcysteine O-methyltransferase Ste14